MTNDRRSFIKQAALTSGALLLPSACKTIGGRSIASDSYLKVSLINPDIPKRVSWSALSQDDKMAFIEAVKSMKTAECLVPNSFGNRGDRKLDRWYAQAESHQWYCVHRTWAFLPWHRCYLFYFEQHLRRIIRDSFRLPYWDWTVDQEFPKELQNAEFMQTLGISRDNTNIAIAGDAGAYKTKEWWQAAFLEIGKGADYDSIGGDADSSGTIESPYHNMVHVGVGGDMGRVPLAAKDPVFWLHHCNVDRLWSLWMDQIINAGNPRLLFPSADVKTWLDMTFDNHYWNAQDKLAAGTVKTSLFTEDMGYNYDTMNKTWTLSDIPSDQSVTEVPAPVETVETTAPTGLRLTATPGSVLALQFAIPAAIFQTPQKLLSLRIKLKNFPVPNDQNLAYTATLVIGNRSLPLPGIAFFPGAHDEHGQGAVGISLNQHLNVLREAAKSNAKGQLVLQLKDRQGRDVAIKDAVPNFTADPDRYSLKLKGVYI